MQNELAYSVPQLNLNYLKLDFALIKSTTSFDLIIQHKVDGILKQHKERAEQSRAEQMRSEQWDWIIVTNTIEIQN